MRREQKFSRQKEAPQTLKIAWKGYRLPVLSLFKGILSLGISALLFFLWRTKDPWSFREVNFYTIVVMFAIYGIVLTVQGLLDLFRGKNKSH